MFRKLQLEQLNNMMYVEEAVVLEDGRKSDYIQLKFQEDKIKKRMEDNEVTRLLWKAYEAYSRVNRGFRDYIENNDDAKEAMRNKRRAMRSGRRVRLYIPPVRNLRKLTSPGRNRYSGIKNHGKNPYKKCFGKIKKGIQFISEYLEAMSAGTLNIA